MGRFLTDSVLGKEAGRSLAQILSMRFPGIRAVALPANPTHYQLVSAHFSTSISHGAKNCGVDIYLDGMLYVDDVDAIFPEDVAGVEFYTITTIPPQYRLGRGTCEVVLIWSKY
jgi:UbiD family decarboxylase